MRSSHEQSTPRMNRLLASLPKQEQERLLPQMESIALRFEENLFDPGERIRHIYFPMNCLISLQVILEDGPTAEVGRVGNEGIVGLPVFLGVRTSFTRAFVQVSGLALRMKASVFQKEARSDGPLACLLLRYTQALLHYSERLTACNTWHSIEQRLCRWLLITHDRVQAERFEVTQEFLARMLGVHRQSVTLAASNLQKSGLIRYSRGKLTILDRRGLEDASCKCFWAVTKEFESMFA